MDVEPQEIAVSEVSGQYVDCQVQTKEAVAEVGKSQTDKHSTYKVWMTPKAGWMSRAWKKHISWDIEKVDQKEFRRARDGRHYTFQEYEATYGNRAINFWNEERRTDWYGKTWTKHEFWKKWGEEQAEKWWNKDCTVFTETLYELPWLKKTDENMEKATIEEPQAEESPAQDPVSEAWEINTVSSAELEDDANILVLDEDEDAAPEKIDDYQDHTYAKLDTAKEVLPHLASSITSFAVLGDWQLPTMEEIRDCNADMRKIYLGGHVFVGKIKNNGGICELVLKNSSEMEWPANTKLRMVCGDGAGICGAKDAPIGIVGPNECVGLQFNFSPGHLPLGYSYWVLESEGKAFGQCLIFERA